MRIAAIHYSVGNKPEAYKIVDGIIKESPKYEEARMARARMLLIDQKPDEAAKEAQEAVKLAPGPVAAQYTLGLTVDRAERPGRWRGRFSKVLKLNPRAAAARLQLARLQLARGEAAGALEAAEEVSRERPEDVEAAVLMSRSLARAG